MYQTGEFIVYGTSGVCRVDAVGKPPFGGEEDKMYYTLVPLSGTETIYIPVDSPVFTRPVISREQAERLIDAIPSIEVDHFTSHSLRMSTEHYQAALQTHDCRDLVQLTPRPAAAAAASARSTSATASGRRSCCTASFPSRGASRSARCTPTSRARSAPHPPKRSKNEKNGCNSGRFSFFCPPERSEGGSACAFMFALKGATPVTAHRGRGHGHILRRARRLGAPSLCNRPVGQTRKREILRSTLFRSE